MALPEPAQFSESEVSNYRESEKLWDIERELCTNLEQINFTSPIKYIYNPLKYATDLHKTFIRNYFENSTKKILFLGINPGPWGMCQTGIPFGDRDHVRNWLQITGLVGKPDREHPERKIVGLNCHRIEKSGEKFWGLFEILCGSPENFFKTSFVYNLCPLAFLDDKGRNLTPKDMKNKATVDHLCRICEETFIKIITEFNFEIVIGIGRFPEKTARTALKKHNIRNVKVLFMPHPSSRSPKYRKDWKLQAFRILEKHDLIRHYNENRNININLLQDNYINRNDVG